MISDPTFGFSHCLRAILPSIVQFIPLRPFYFMPCNSFNWFPFQDFSSRCCNCTFAMLGMGQVSRDFLMDFPEVLLSYNVGRWHRLVFTISDPSIMSYVQVILFSCYPPRLPLNFRNALVPPGDGNIHLHVVPLTLAYSFSIDTCYCRYRA